MRDSDEAVGLLNRSEALLTAAFLAEVGTGDGALRARAREAAVGAYRFEDLEGVMFVRAGVFGRAGEADVTLAGVFLAAEDVVD